MTPLTRRFLDGTVAAGEFGHAEHVLVARELLLADSFLSAATRYVDGITRLASAAGAPEKVNVTMTLAFLALIGERLAEAPGDSGDAFLRAHPNLLDRSVLSRWYSGPRLAGDLARRQLVLPDRSASA